MLRVSQQGGGQPEIFHSLQGEGANIGAPSVFLRLALCNLTCTWCDTKYTWDWQNYDYQREVISLEVGDVARRIQGFGCPRLVITGGEPLLQQVDLVPLVETLNAQGFYCEVETNGTIIPNDDLAQLIDQWNVSPKLATSGNAAARREVSDVMEFFAGLPNAYLKFVVVEPRDIDEVCAWRDRYGLRGERIILMPEGRATSDLAQRSSWISEACVREGFRFSTRLHILLWADQRGR